MASHFRSLEIKNIRRETPDCISISFLVPDLLKDEFTYKAGQNITIKAEINGEELRRSYSLCSSPDEKEFRIAIKKAYEGQFSTYAHEHFQTGQFLNVLTPTGNFFLTHRKENIRHYIAFVAGSGITPVISIIKNILKSETNSRITLIYGNRTRTDVIFREELESIKNLHPEKIQLIYIFSREKMDAPFFEGRIDTEKCEWLFDKLIPLRHEQIFLLCGPSHMIFDIKGWLFTHGIDEKNIHYELFSNPNQTSISNAKSTPKSVPVSHNKSLVKIRLDGITQIFQVPMNGPTILDWAIRDGADLPYACRAGVCASCRAKLVQGKVSMDQNYALADEELNDGFILACQSHPASEELFIDFDTR